MRDDRSGSPLLGYGVAIASVMVATLLRLVLDPVLGTRFPFATLFFAVLVSAWIGGFGPAVLASLSGAAAASWFLLAPRYRLFPDDVESLGGLVLYLGVSLGIAVIGGAMRRAQSRAEAASRAELLRREQLQVTLRSIGDAVITTDMNGIVTSLNSVAATLTGWPDSTAVGHPLDEVFHIVNEQTRQPVANPALTALKHGTIVGLANHTVLIARDGSESPIDDSAAPIRDDDGTVRGVVLIFRDVSERRRSEAVILSREQELTDFFENANVGLHWIGPDGIILRANRAELEMFGYSPEEYIGRHISVFHVDHEVIEDILARLAVGERLQNRPARMRAKDGSIRDVLINSTALREGDRVVHTRCFTLDVTARRRVDEAQTLLAAVVESSDDAIITKDLRGIVTSWNAGAQRLFGYTPEEVIGQSILRIVPAERADDVTKILAAIGRGERIEHFESERVRKDGARVNVSLSVSPIRDASGRITGASKIARDITEQKRLERERLLALRELTTLYEVSQAVSAELDPERVLQTITNAATDLSGAQFGAFFYNVTDPDGGHYMLFTLAGAPRDAFEQFGMPRNTAVFAPTFAGEAVVRVGNIRDDPRYGQNAPHHGTPAGHLPVTSYLAVPVTSRLGEVYGGLFMGHPDANVFTAESERAVVALAAQAAIALEKAKLYQAEQRARAAAEQASREKDNFLAMLGHELRNPLSSVRNALTASTLDASRAPRALEIASHAATHLTRLVDDLLDVTRVTQGRLTLRREPSDFGDVVARAGEALKPLFDERGVTLRTTLSPRPCIVDGDATRLEQVVGNLLTNAAKYSEPGGQVTATVEPVDGSVVLRVTDSGMGIPPELLPRIFNLFVQGEQALDRARGGLGIGLTLVKKLVDLHGGTVEAHSDGPGRGAEFVVRLPATTRDLSAPAAGAAGVPAVRAATRVLIVEDNADAAESLVLLLEVLGLRVRAVGDGPTALQAARANPPDVMLVDIGLPGMSGYEVAQQIRQDPQLRGTVLVALTGYGQEEDRHRALAAGFDYHMVKPVEVDKVQGLIASLAPTRPLIH
jgi:PAS domain S-box-containing protein